MSDHDAAPDPIDQAYAQAEAVLADEAARAARRARVLAAVGGEPKAAPAASPAPTWRSTWRRGVGLAAAAVAGLSVLLATHFRSPTPTEVAPAPSPDATRPRATSAPPPANAAAPTPPAPPPATPAASPRAARGKERKPRAAAPGPAAHAAPPAVAEARAPTAAPSAPPIPPLPVPPVMHHIEEPTAPPAPAQEDGASAARVTATPAPRAFPADEPQAARLVAAAAAGRIDEVRALLADGVPVDATQADGETALMKSVRAGQPAVAALLRQHGASLDRRNRAGESARDIAAAKGDARLNAALGLAP